MFCKQIKGIKRRQAEETLLCRFSGLYNTEVNPHVFFFLFFFAKGRGIQFLFDWIGTIFASGILFSLINLSYLALCVCLCYCIQSNFALIDKMDNIPSKLKCQADLGQSFIKEKQCEETQKKTILFYYSVVLNVLILFCHFFKIVIVISWHLCSRNFFVWNLR